MPSRYDVIVVGGGHAALCAAISAREQGASVLLLETASATERGGTVDIPGTTEPEIFVKVEPPIASFATDIALCGPVGCGQTLWILNNVLLFQNVVALCEAKAIGERLGMNPEVLFGALSNASADSFALRNHAVKAVLPDDYPLKAFSVNYAMKDLRYMRWTLFPDPDDNRST